MSYILDALRRAETERDRGQVPGLNAQPAPAPAPPSASRSPPAARWLALSLAAVVAGLLSWWLWRSPAAPPPVVVSAGAAPTAPVTPAAGPAAAPAPAPLPVVVSAPPPPAAAVPVPPPVVAAVAVPSVPPAAAATPASSATAARTVALASLTAEQRRDWPPLAIGGAVYSEHPASRFVVIAGQLVREGDAAAPGVTVERIGPRSVLLRWRDLRVEVPL